MVTDVITAILAVFTKVGEWFVSFVPSLYALFWSAETGLTFLGVLSVMALAISITLLVIHVIQNFLHFRG